VGQDGILRRVGNPPAGVMCAAGRRIANPPQVNNLPHSRVRDNDFIVMRGAFWFAGLLAAGQCAFALNPALEVSQYAHKSWPIGEGFLKGRVRSIAQTADGYIWLGTEFGLLRFDGVRTTGWEPPPNQHLPSDLITCLLAGRDGTLWIGTRKGLASWKDGKLSTYAELAGVIIEPAGLFEDREGSIWAGGYAQPNGKLCAIRKGSVHCDEAGGRFGAWVNGFYEDKTGNLWAGSERGLWRWKPGPPQLYPIPEPNGVMAVGGADDAEPLIGTYRRLRRLVGGKAEEYSLPGQSQPSYVTSLLRDRDGGLWIAAANRGLTHVGLGRTDRFAESEGLSADSVIAIFEDREGNVWVSTAKGLDRFRDFAVPMISGNQMSTTAGVSVALPARDGSVWIGTAEGLKRWNHGEVWAYRERRAPQPADRRVVKEVVGSGLADRTVTALFQDHRGRIWVATPGGVGYLENDRLVPLRAIPTGNVQSIVEDTAGNLWFAHVNLLIGLAPDGGVQQIPWTTLGSSSFAEAVAADPVGGGLWLGFFQSGIAYWKDGRVRASYAASNGLAGGYVNDLWYDREGALWISTEGGLSRLKDGRLATLTRENGLPCAAVHWAMEDDGHSFWLYTSCGLLRVARSELEALASGAGRALHTVLFDPFDGVRVVAINSFLAPRVAKSPDGKIWFQRTDGVGVIDPSHLTVNNLAPPVHIEQIVADRKPYDANSGLRLPPLIRDLQIDYTALSFAAPEKVQFRFTLEGRDTDWQDAGTRRQAFYSDLPPRNYRFRVIACNNSGVWNEAGASLDFSVAPAYYQSAWFQASCVAAFAGLLAGLYQLRLRHVARQFNMRMEERVAERTRIARDLHDTMLQSFQAVLLKLSVVAYRIKDPPEAREQLETIVEQAREAVTEGRDAVQGLRSSTVTTNELAQAIRTLGEELAADPKSPHGPEFQVYVEGATRDLAPIVRDEVYRIASEAVRNAFRHGQATRIEVEIEYGPRQFRLCVRDNGKGIDLQILDAGGRSGHHGMPGMRERATLAGGKLAVFSRPGSGTEVELTIPAAFAYLKPNASRQSQSSDG
jgi:signal transduction histidine kinase/ligand-binding sensor domain-containing protein